ncbi:serine family amino acid catabolism- protein [Diplocarpon rosae]|nr:serine family amino acid catabolism- protein [Diplocarpon rosae]
MASSSGTAPKPWVTTPLIRSTSLSLSAGCNVYLKLETLQPSGSFKSRGIGNTLLSAIKSRGPSKSIHFYCSSGGNAGLACVTAATTLKCRATIVVPMSAPRFMIEKLEKLGADVRRKGLHWGQADAYLREELLAEDENGVYVPPFDHPDIWAGHATIIDELEVQMGGEGYDAVVCSVGGGGLFSGVMQGLEQHGHLNGGKSKPVKVMAVETKGADSLNLSIINGRLMTLPAITSIALCLGATQVAPKALEWGMREEVTSVVLSDAEAAMAYVKFADDERILVETSCGVSIATAYTDTLHTALFPSLSAAEFAKLNIVILVCGGSNVSLQILESYKEKYSHDPVVQERFYGWNGGRRESSAEPKVPFILHNEEEHKRGDKIVSGRNFEGEQVMPKPAIGTMEQEEVERQIEEFGKVVLTKT